MREKVEVKASTGSVSKGDRKEFSGVYDYPETLAESADLLGGEDEAVSALNETLTRRYQAQLRGSGKSTKTQQLYDKMVAVMVDGGVSQEDAAKFASKSTGYVPVEAPIDAPE